LECDIFWVMKDLTLECIFCHRELLQKERREPKMR
jgi:hypothetical protein